MERIPTNKNPIEGRDNKATAHLVKMFERGLDDEEAIGYHGTSMETIQYIIKHGHMPGQQHRSKLGYKKGDLFFFPRKSAFQDHEHRDNFEEDDEKVLEQVRGYAGDIARAHFIANKFGLDLKKESDSNFGRTSLVLKDANDEKIIKRLMKEGRTLKEIEETFEEAERRKGVILALDKSVLTNHKIGMGDYKVQRDLRIMAGPALAYNLISGIEPEGQIEWDFFEKLQREINGS